MSKPTRKVPVFSAIQYLCPVGLAMELSKPICNQSYTAVQRYCNLINWFDLTN